MNTSEDLLKEQRRIPYIMCGALCSMGFLFLYMVITQPIAPHNVGRMDWHYSCILAVFLAVFNLYKFRSLNLDKLSKTIIDEMDLNAKLKIPNHQNAFDRMDDKSKEQYLFVGALGHTFLRRMVFNEFILFLGFFSVKIGMPKNFYYIFLVVGIGLLIYMAPSYDKSVSIYKKYVQ